MLLSDETIWAIPDGASGIEFVDREVGKYFLEQFNIEWKVAVEAVAEEHEDCLRDNPASSVEKEGKMIVSFVPLDIPFMDDMYCDINKGPEALEKAIESTKKEFPDAEFMGCIQFAWSDMHGGDVIKFDVSTKQMDEPYAFVGEILREAINDEEEYFWEQIEDVDDIDEIAADLKFYKEWVGEEAIDRLADIDDE